MNLRDLHLPNRKVKKIILPLLLTALLTYFLSHTEVFNFLLTLWNETRIVSCLAKSAFESETSPPPPPPPPPETTRPSPTSTAPSKPDVWKSCYTHLSPENAREGRRLLDSTAWPETQPLASPFSLNLTTSGAHSSFSIVPRGGGWRVGDELTVSIQLRDFNHNPKKNGGDFLVSRLHNRQLGAGVVGRVQDHLDGTFTAVFPLLWNGTADVEVTLVQTSESITFLKRLTEEQPGRIYFGSDFRSEWFQTMTICNVCLDPKRFPLCNFTDPNTGEQWFCYKPQALSCSTRATHFKGGFNVNISQAEEALFRNGINMKAPIKALGSETILIQPKAVESTHKTTGPSGYYYMNQWRSLKGPAVRPFNDASAITECLSGKKLHLFGDSTVRLFYEHITKVVPDFLTFDQDSALQSGPLLAVDYNNDIMVTYRCHGPPIRYQSVPTSELRYVANELDGLAGGADAVVVIGVWSHFSTFPAEVYYQRLMTIRRAARRLLHRAPGTKVIVRSANMKAMTLFESLTNSDWYSLQRDKVLRAVFRDMNVLLLDAWEMVQAHDLPHNLHPQPEILKNMMDVILSHTCPENAAEMNL